MQVHVLREQIKALAVHFGISLLWIIPEKLVVFEMLKICYFFVCIFFSKPESHNIRWCLLCRISQLWIIAEKWELYLKWLKKRIFYLDILCLMSQNLKVYEDGSRKITEDSPPARLFAISFFLSIFSYILEWLYMRQCLPCRWMRGTRARGLATTVDNSSPGYRTWATSTTTSRSAHAVQLPFL